MSKEEEEKSFKVKDRRRFTETGDLKDGDEGGEAVAEAAAEEPPEADDSATQGAPAAAAETGPQQPDEPPASGGVPAEVNFVSFVMSLATQAAVQLGDMPGPAGINIPVDRLAAKQTIDIIQMLKDKTEGNLDESEARLIENVLHELHMSFIRSK